MRSMAFKNGFRYVEEPGANTVLGKHTDRY
jgi:hypothetical protein